MEYLTSSLIRIISIINGKILGLKNEATNYKFPSKQLTSGLNLLGICENKFCHYFKRNIVENIKENKLDLLKDKNFDMICPFCKSMTKIETIDFYQTKYKIEFYKNYEIYKTIEDRVTNKDLDVYSLSILINTCNIKLSNIIITIEPEYNYFNLKEYAFFEKESNYSKEKNENINFLSNYNISKEILRLEQYIGIKLSEEEIKEVFLDDYKLQNLRNQKIESLSEYILNTEMNYIEYGNKISELTHEIKNDIIFRVFHNPEKFIKIEEMQKIPENSPNFIKPALQAYLYQNGIITCFEKNPKKNKNIELAMLQILACGDIYKQSLKLRYSFDKEKEYKILNYEKERNNFYNIKKKEFAKILNTDENDIIISNIREGCILCDIRRRTGEITTDDLRKILESDGITFVNNIRIVEGMYIDEIFDCRGNRSDNWGIGEKRGPPGFKKDYDPPIGYNGYGLNVKDRYDNGNNNWLSFLNIPGEWYIAYHGTGELDAFKGILRPNGEGIRPGRNQVHRSKNNINPLNSSIMPICGIGTYLTPKVSEAEFYSKMSKYLELNGEKYYFLIMCRVNPYKIWISSANPDYWIVSGDPNETDYDSYKRNRSRIPLCDIVKPIDEIRPYRLLLKKEKNLQKDKKLGINNNSINKTKRKNQFNNTRGKLIHNRTKKKNISPINNNIRNNNNSAINNYSPAHNFSSLYSNEEKNNIKKPIINKFYPMKYNLTTKNNINYIKNSYNSNTNISSSKTFNKEIEATEFPKEQNNQVKSDDSLCLIF